MEEKIFSAKTLDEAITKACVELGVPSDELDYTVRQKGSNGFLGIGARQYVISAKVRTAAEETVQEMPAPAETGRAETEKPEAAHQASPAPQPAPTKEERPAAKPERKPENKEKRQDKRDRNERGKADRKEKPERQKKQEKGGSQKEASVKQENSVEPRKAERRMEKPAEDPTPKAEAFLNALFQSMDMQISCKAEFHPDNNTLDIELSGDDMGVLIGKRGQTLDALQYLTSQVINKHQSAYVRVKLDTENYRERRRETLETLAVNIAHKVRRSHRPVALEPMNPYERRIIHSILQGEKDVTTRSEGEEPYRHVIVCPVRRRKQGGRYNNKQEAAKAEIAQATPEETAPIEENFAEEIISTGIEVAEVHSEQVIAVSDMAGIPAELIPEGSAQTVEEAVIEQ